MRSVWLSLATLGPIGHLPAPGSCASLLTLALVYFLQVMHVDPTTYLIILGSGIVLGWFIIKKALAALDRSDDPSEIVFDEVLGCLLTFWAIPFSAYTLIIGFIIFRILDITKGLGVASFEIFFGAWGIILDDLAAGLLSNIFLHVIIFFLHDYLI